MLRAWRTGYHNIHGQLDRGTRRGSQADCSSMEYGSESRRNQGSVAVSSNVSMSARAALLERKPERKRALISSPAGGRWLASRIKWRPSAEDISKLVKMSIPRGHAEDALSPFGGRCRERNIHVSFNNGLTNTNREGHVQNMWSPRLHIDERCSIHLNHFSVEVPDNDIDTLFEAQE